MSIDPGLHRQLDQLIGTWRTRGRILDTGETWEGVDIYEWFPGEQQFVHRVDVHILGSRTEAIEFFTPREGSADTFDQVSFDSTGQVDHAVGSFDTAGRYHNVAADARAVLTVEAPALMTAHWEMRRDDGTWTDWMDVEFTRIGEPRIEVRSKSDHTL